MDFGTVKKWLCHVERPGGLQAQIEVEAKDLESARETLGSQLLKNNYQRGKVVGQILKTGDIGEEGDGWLE